MEISNRERVIFDDIQKKLFYMIPEKWDAIYLYASFVEDPLRKPVGEMYFYYLPKGILKRKPVNVYQIPGMFNIDEESYNELIQRLFFNIKQLRAIHKECNPKIWSNITISIENFQFKIEYAYEDLGKKSEFTPYERHIIWRYKHLNDDFDFQTKEEKNIINNNTVASFSPGLIFDGMIGGVSVFFNGMGAVRPSPSCSVIRVRLSNISTR